jgi:signal transduction histidine kinase
VETYAGVISNSLWHFEPQAPTDYLTLIVGEQNYEHVRVMTEDGLVFVDVQSNQLDALTRLLIVLRVIQRVEITADIQYEGNNIGKINAVWLNNNAYTYFYVLILVILLVGVIWLYWHIVQSNRELEIGVQERTAELYSANIDLGESEARYRSIFEDSPISLREEDFSGVKKILDQLQTAGVSDFRTYFDQHTEAISDCVRAVKVLNVNQNTLELFKTDNKERLYQGLTDMFTGESLIIFGQQLADFKEGKTHFECETIQQTVTGEKLWVGTSVTIAPGYEKTWEKVFVSIIDITDRKQAEAELTKYHEQLEELVAGRTSELVALKHDLEQRVIERTEELAQVNKGLNIEIVERKRLQEEVQHYTEELEQRVADRTRELSVLYDVTAVASQVLDLDELLFRSLERSLSAMRSKAGIIQLVDESMSMLHPNTQQGVSDTISDGIEAFYSTQEDIKEHFIGHSSLIIPDLESDPRFPQSVRDSEWSTYIGVPIQDTRGKLLGILSILGETEYQLSSEELTLLTSIADHIGLAVENVRLRRQAKETAVLEDRQRLARELHDAVNQNLFSASVIAETLPQLWERKPQIVQKNLGDLHRLIRGALAEMRILLLELRPVSMADAILCELLQQLVDGVKGRTYLDITLQIQGECEIPTQVKKNLFRIAQEALNNVVKHAQAQHVQLMLNQSGEQIILRINDDGQGFDVSELYSGGHLGLQIMRERAKSIGANLSISSHFGLGTEIVAIWPDGGEES